MTILETCFTTEIEESPFNLTDASFATLANTTLSATFATCTDHELNHSICHICEEKVRGERTICQSCNDKLKTKLLFKHNNGRYVLYSKHENLADAIREDLVKRDKIKATPIDDPWTIDWDTTVPASTSTTSSTYPTTHSFFANTITGETVGINTKAQAKITGG